MADIRASPSVIRWKCWNTSNQGQLYHELARLVKQAGRAFFMPSFSTKVDIIRQKKTKKTLDQIRQKSTKSTNLAANPKKPSIPCGARVSGQFRVCQRSANPSTPLKPLRRKGFGVFSGFASRGTSLPLGGVVVPPKGRPAPLLRPIVPEAPCRGPITGRQARGFATCKKNALGGS